MNPTIWTDNAEAFTTRQPQAIDQERHAAVRATLAHIVDGKPGKALYTLVRSVERQARIAGAGHHDIHPTCPCPGRCDHGTVINIGRTR